MVVAIGNRAASDGDQMGGLGSGKGLAVALLSFVLEDRLQPSFRIPLTNPHDRIATDIKGGTKFCLSPALSQLEQDAGARKGASVGTTAMDEGVKRGLIGFGQGQGWG